MTRFRSRPHSPEGRILLKAPHSPEGRATRPFRITLKTSAGDYPYSRGRPAPIPTRSGGDPGGAGRVPVQGRARPGHLRRQGEVAAAAAEPVLRRLHPAPPAHPGDAHDRRERRLDGREDRGRGAAAGVLLDQGVRPPVQRQVPRRQELPLPRGHHGRGVPAGHGDARREKEGHQVLRPVQPRLGDPRHGGHPAARLPRPHLLQGRLQAGRADRPPVPARLHRQVLRALREAHLGRGPPAARRGLLRLHVRPDRALHQEAHRRDEGSRRRGGVRAGRPAQGRRQGPGAGAGEAGRGARRRHRLRRDRPRGRPARGRRADLLRARRANTRPARLGS